MKIIPFCNYLYLIILHYMKTERSFIITFINIYTVYFFVNLLIIISLTYYFN